MWILFGLIVGSMVFCGFWAFVGPFVALLNFLVGRFFIAAVIMAGSLFCMTVIWDDFKMGREEFVTLLVLGLVLEAVKKAVQIWWNYRPRQAEVEAEPHITISLMDDEPVMPVMRDVTPRVRRLSRW